VKIIHEKQKTGDFGVEQIDLTFNNGSCHSNPFYLHKNSFYFPGSRLFWEQRKI